MTDIYDSEFFHALSGGARESARAVLPLVVDLIDPHCVVDVGCGTGEWLSVLAELTDCETVGLDGEYVPADLLAIPREFFVAANLSQPLHLDRRFDLAISLEVAEHLPESRAAGFVRDLTRLAPAVLFSASIPDQGGVGHINEQWQGYWIGLFAEHGFEAHDIIRPALWNNHEVAFCYRQNMFLFVDPDVHGHRPDLAPTMADVVHPDLFRLVLDAKDLPTLREVLIRLPPASGRSIRYHLSQLSRMLRR